VSYICGRLYITGRRVTPVIAKPQKHVETLVGFDIGSRLGDLPLLKSPPTTNAKFGKVFHGDMKLFQL
jgi:hypothetical protein